MVGEDYHRTCTVSWGQDGVKKLQGLEHIKQADVLFVFARRMKLDEGQMKLIRAHWEAGKAVIGVRTASHAFQAADNELFDRKVMGGNYEGHFGIEPVKVLNVAKDHPVLRNVGAIPPQPLIQSGATAGLRLRLSCRTATLARGGSTP